MKIQNLQNLQNLQKNIVLFFLVTLITSGCSSNTGEVSNVTATDENLSVSLSIQTLEGKEKDVFEKDESFKINLIVKNNTTSDIEGYQSNTGSRFKSFVSTRNNLSYEELHTDSDIVDNSFGLAHLAVLVPDTYEANSSIQYELTFPDDFSMREYSYDITFQDGSTETVSYNDLDLYQDYKNKTYKEKIYTSIYEFLEPVSLESGDYTIYGDLFFYYEGSVTEINQVTVSIE
jgi:hypothetical protein